MEYFVQVATWVGKVKAIIPFMIETQIHTARPTCMLCFIACDVVRNRGITQWRQANSAL